MTERIHDGLPEDDDAAMNLLVHRLEHDVRSHANTGNWMEHQFHSGAGIVSRRELIDDLLRRGTHGRSYLGVQRGWASRQEPESQA